MSMEENNLSHNSMSTLRTSSRKPLTTSLQSPSSFSSLEPNEKLKNNTTTTTTQEYCVCPNSNDDDDVDKGKEQEEGHSESNHNMVKVGDDVEETGRERLKRLREEVMMENEVKIPENWGQEQKLKDWMDYTMFDGPFFAPHSLIVAARDALIANARKAKSPRFRI